MSTRILFTYSLEQTLQTTKTNMLNTYVEDLKRSTLPPHWLGRRERFRGTFETETAPKPCIGL